MSKDSNKADLIQEVRKAQEWTNNVFTAVWDLHIINHKKGDKKKRLTEARERLLTHLNNELTLSNVLSEKLVRASQSCPISTDWINNITSFHVVSMVKNLGEEVLGEIHRRCVYCIKAQIDDGLFDPKDPTHVKWKRLCDLFKTCDTTSSGVINSSELSSLLSDAYSSYFDSCKSFSSEIVRVDGPLAVWVKTVLLEVEDSLDADAKQQAYTDSDETKTVSEVSLSTREAKILEKFCRAYEMTERLMNQVEIGALVNLERSSVSGYLRKLENKGCIHRPVGDRKGYKPTGEGLAWFAKIKRT